MGQELRVRPPRTVGTAWGSKPKARSTAVRRRSFSEGSAGQTDSDEPRRQPANAGTPPSGSAEHHAETGHEDPLPQEAPPRQPERSTHRQHRRHAARQEAAVAGDYDPSAPCLKSLGGAGDAGRIWRAARYTGFASRNHASHNHELIIPVSDEPSTRSLTGCLLKGGRGVGQ